MRRLDGLLLWLFIPLLTTSLLLLVKPAPWGYEPVQSLHIFRNLPLFAALYFVWLSLLLFLLWRVRGFCEAAVLVSSFALVHVGTIVLATHYGASQDWLKGADPVQIQQTGNLDFRGYSDFPALAIVGALLATVTDVDMLTLRTPLLLIWLVALSTLLLVGYSRLLKSLPLAALAVLLAIQSNLMLARFYLHPAYMGVLLVVALLGFLLEREHPLTPRERLMLILFVVGLTVTHFVSSVVGVLIIAGYYLERRWRRQPEIVSQVTVTLGLVLVAAWAIYWTTQTFPSLVGYLPKIDERFRQGVAFFYVQRVTRANTEGLPSWVTALQTFWWVAVYLGGGVLALRGLLLRRRLSMAAPSYGAAYVLLVAAVVVGSVVSPGGYNFYRLIVYGSFLAAPLVVHFLLAGSRAKILPLAVSGAFLVLSFPTLLAHNTAIGQQSTHPSEVAAAKFLSRGVAGKENVTRLFGGYFGPDRVNYYAPGLIPNNVLFPKQGADIVDVEEGKALWGSYVEAFVHEADRGRDAVFVFDYQDVVFWRHLFRLPENDPLWSEVRQGLSQADLFYDAGRVQFYRSVPTSGTASRR